MRAHLRYYANTSGRHNCRRATSSSVARAAAAAEGACPMASVLHHPARPLRVGVCFHPQHCTYEQYAAAVRRADELGVDTIWDWDHFFPTYGPADGPHFEGWTLLTAMALLSQRAEIG